MIDVRAIKASLVHRKVVAASAKCNMRLQSGTRRGLSQTSMRPFRLLFAVAVLGAGSVLPARADGTLYDSLGQRAGLIRIVDRLAELWLSDDRIKDDFSNINMDRLKQRLVDQLCQVADGPCQYKGHSMQASHKGLHLDQAKFNAVTEDLQTSMEQSGVSYWTQNRLIARLAPMQRDIVSR